MSNSTSGDGAIRLLIAIGLEEGWLTTDEDKRLAVTRLLEAHMSRDGIVELMPALAPYVPD